MTTVPPASLPRRLYTLLVTDHLLIFLVCILLTGLVSIPLSAYQTTRPFFPAESSLWNVYKGDTIPTALVFVVHYALLTPLIYHFACVTRLSSPSTLALGLPSATMIAVLIVEMGKGYVGRLRPSFATVCMDAAPTKAWLDLPSILSDAACPAADKKLLHDARRSFPSGHAALAVCGAAYFQLCLMRALPKMEGSFRRLALYSLGWGAMLWAAYVSASRVFDNAHHVSDVAVGMIVGLWTARVHFLFVAGEIDRERATKED
ncbi:Lipid phosphate phosphohydrolase [Chondrus crispus]|uniref:Lipid phosphate phosphohydrolase n=1 Tax=Chondrus crispus TaxID=2769 RepID=R7Q951_CHOCR|nr:Lipid phosphate phosphohydrolase [Chondrus crispus]CDF33921.1 Lipid phosphate phosphohydrolase [Chondrus crispus]|eukprot:XP_005713740.1 Lipid phosphate phosphohydrolase [Chondrus crispus]